jgi:hypothetical protein
MQCGITLPPFNSWSTRKPRRLHTDMYLTPITKLQNEVHRRTSHEGPEPVCVQRHAPAALSREIPGTHSIGAGVGPGAGLDG